MHCHTGFCCTKHHCNVSRKNDNGELCCSCCLLMRIFANGNGIAAQRAKFQASNQVKQQVSHPPQAHRLLPIWRVLPPFLLQPADCMHRPMMTTATFSESNALQQAGMAKAQSAAVTMHRPVHMAACQCVLLIVIYLQGHALLMAFNAVYSLYSSPLPILICSGHACR